MTMIFGHLCILRTFKLLSSPNRFSVLVIFLAFSSTSLRLTFGATRVSWNESVTFRFTFATNSSYLHIASKNAFYSIFSAHFCSFCRPRLRSGADSQYLIAALNDAELKDDSFYADESPGKSASNKVRHKIKQELREAMKRIDTGFR